MHGNLWGYKSLYTPLGTPLQLEVRFIYTGESAEHEKRGI